MTAAELRCRERLQRIWAQRQADQIDDEQATKAMYEAQSELFRAREQARLERSEAGNVG